MVFTAALLASTVADTVTRSFAGQTPVFTLPFFAAPSLATLPLFLLLGLICGAAGVLFNKSLLKAMDLAARLPSPIVFAGVCGLGSGHSVVESAARRAKSCWAARRCGYCCAGW